MLTELDVLGEVEQALMIRVPTKGSDYPMSAGYVPGYVNRHVYQTRYAVDQGALTHDLASFLVRSLVFHWSPPPDFNHWALLEQDGWTEDQVYIATHDYTIHVPELWNCDYFTQWWGNTVHLFSPIED